MRTIKVSNLARLTNGKLLSFARLVRTEGEASGDERVNSLINQLDAKTEAMSTAMMYDKTNAMTEKVESLSDSINQNFRVLRKLSSAMPYSSVDPIAQAGQSLSGVFDKYGDISRLPYEDKSAKLSLLLKDIEALDLAIFDTLGFSFMVGSLKSDHEEFDTVYLQRNSYRDTIKAKVAAARTEVEDVLTRIINYVATMSDFEEAFDKYAGSMDEFFVWNIVSNKSDSSDTVSDGQTAESSDTAVVNEAYKGEPSDEDMES